MVKYEIEEIHDGEYIKVLKQYSREEQSEEPLIILIPGNLNY
jgi:hypothetical protein